ncbi:MAG TPA: DUF5625 family protein [Gallionella sp.]|nr:DUF5625 family protein [Gallionella sp.]
MPKHKAGLNPLICIAMLTLFPWLTACADDARPPKPPLFVLFEAQKAGSMFTTKLKVVEHRRYMFTLMLGAKKGETIEEARRINELAGSDARYKDGTPVSYGIPIPLKLKVSVIEPSGERIIYDKDVHEMEKIGATMFGFEKLIDYIELKPGLYRIDIQSLNDIPELAESPITFGIFGRPNSTPID